MIYTKKNKNKRKTVTNFLKVKRGFTTGKANVNLILGSKKQLLDYCTVPHCTGLECSSFHSGLKANLG